MKFLKEIWLWLPVIIQMGLVWLGAYLIYGLVKWLLELVFPDKPVVKKETEDDIPNDLFQSPNAK